jgi:CAAX prenyl protease-like protein
MLRSPSLPYVLPFAVFIALLAGLPLLALPLRIELLLWILIVGAVLLIFSSDAIDLGVGNFPGSIAVGVAVFVVWIAPDLVFPGYRETTVSFPPEARDDPVALMLRAARAVLLVPIVEELFWRAWLPRWVVNSHDFRAVPLGTYTPFAFAVTAVLFAVEHGAYWDVGLLAGIAYNAWMWRTRRLGDCILAHAVTNACLAAYVIAAGQWQYW